jgi:hypothetical protein
MTLTSCSAIKTTYKTITGSVKGTAWVVRGTSHHTNETTRLVYHISKFTSEIVRAPLGVYVDEGRHPDQVDYCPSE